MYQVHVYVIIIWIIARFNFRYTAVQLMGSGMTPSKAALFSIKPIINFYPEFNGAVIAVNTKGQHGKLSSICELLNFYFTNYNHFYHLQNKFPFDSVEFLSLKITSYLNPEFCYVFSVNLAIYPYF